VIPLVTASEQGKAQACNPGRPPLLASRRRRLKPGPQELWPHDAPKVQCSLNKVPSHLERCTIEGESPVGTDSERGMSESLLDPQRVAVAESGCLRVQPESGWYTPPKAKYTVGDR